MVDVRFLFKQMPSNRSLTRPWLVEITTNRALMTGTPQHSLHATVPRSAVWRVDCKLNPCTQALRMGDERFYPTFFNVFYFYYVFTFFNVFIFFSERFLHLCNCHRYFAGNGHIQKCYVSAEWLPILEMFMLCSSIVLFVVWSNRPFVF